MAVEILKDKWGHFSLLACLAGFSWVQQVKRTVTFQLAGRGLAATLVGSFVSNLANFTGGFKQDLSAEIKILLKSI